LLLGATLVVLGIIESGKDALPWAQQAEWVLLVLVTTATTFQYAGELANLARLGAYAHRMESVIDERTKAGGEPVGGRIPSYEHWSKDTQHWIQHQFVISAIAWVLIGVGAQGVPFLFASPRVEYWPLLMITGFAVSVVAPALYGWRSNVMYEKAVAAEGWPEAAGSKSDVKET
jgi:hypothetical protein